MALRVFAAMACFGLPALGREQAQGTMCGGTDAQGGCHEPCRNASADSESARCECDIGPNGKGGVAARWCKGGSLYLAYYEGKTEAQCMADPSVYTTKVPASFSWADFDGEVCRPDPDDSTRSYMLTCNGVEDYQGFVKKTYNNTNCGAGGLIETLLEGQFQASCRCMSNGWQAPRSECASCDPSEYTCSSHDACGLARTTDWSQGQSTLQPMCTASQVQLACQCTSGNYKTSLVCLGGRAAELTYVDSNYSTCRAHPGLFTLKQYVTYNTGCQQSSMNGARSGEQVCTGVADYQPPKQRLYTDEACQTSLMEVPGTVNEVCACMPQTNAPRSSCRSCGSQDECQYQGGCEMAELGDGQCVWNTSAPTGNKCRCWSRNYQSSLCFGGKVNEVRFADVDYETCANRDATQIALKKPKDPTHDPSGMQCQQTGEQQGAQSTIRNTCTGVADGGLPKQRYYSDNACKTEVPDLARASNWVETCSCIGHMQCVKGTKFEKFACDPAGGGVIAAEYEDSECKTPTSITRKYPSPGDGALNQCVDFPPPVINPNAEHQLRFTCPGGNLTAEYWEKGDDCASDPTAKLDSWSDCVCVDEFRFFDQLKRDYETVAGDVKFRVDDVAKALAEKQFVNYIKQAVAQTAGVPPEAVTDLELSAGRRLSESNRRLQGGDVVATYKVVLPKAHVAAAKAALSEVTAAEMNAILSEKPALSFSFEATNVGAVTSAPTSPNDSAATRDDPVPEASTTPGSATIDDAFAHAPGLAAAMLVVVAAAA